MMRKTGIICFMAAALLLGTRQARADMFQNGANSTTATFGNLVNKAGAASARTSLGLGSAATTNLPLPWSDLTGTPTTLSGYGITDGLKTTNNLSDIPTPATARSNLGSWPQKNAVTDLGFVGDGATSNAAALSTMFALTGSPTVYFPAGTYMIGCPTTPLIAASALSIVGDGAGVSVLKFSAGCNPQAGTGALEWLNASNFVIRGITLDMNGAQGAGGGAGTTSAGIRIVCSTGFTINRNAIINAGGNALGIGVYGNTGCSSADFHIDDNYIALTTATGATVNECIALSQGTGTITRGYIDHNTCINTGLQIDGSYIHAVDNDISGWGFGTGIFQVPSSSHHDTITGNKLHDSLTAFDVNSTSPGGVELDGDYSTFANNTCENLGGPCVVLFGSHNLVANNINTNADLATPQTANNQGAFRVVSNPGQSLFPTGNTIENNVDFGGASQLYNYYEADTTGVDNRVVNNRFSGASTQAYKILSATTQTEWVPIAVQTASASANLAFTGIDNAGYRRFRIECTNLVPASVASGAGLGFVLGEGTTPTYETTGYSYFLSQGASNAASATVLNSTAASNIILSNFGQTGSTFTIEFGSLSDANNRKFFFSGTGYNNVGNLFSYQGAGGYSADTNPITAFRLNYTAQNITSGSCVLKGKP